MKLPPFHEEKNDLDAYLNSFEQTCKALMRAVVISVGEISTRSGRESEREGCIIGT